MRIVFYVGLMATMQLVFNCNSKKDNSLTKAQSSKILDDLSNNPSLYQSHVSLDEDPQNPCHSILYTIKLSIFKSSDYENRVTIIRENNNNRVVVGIFNGNSTPSIDTRNSCTQKFYFKFENKAPNQTSWSPSTVTESDPKGKILFNNQIGHAGKKYIYSDDSYPHRDSNDLVVEIDYKYAL